MNHVSCFIEMLWKWSKKGDGVIGHEKGLLFSGVVEIP